MTSVASKLLNFPATSLLIDNGYVTQSDNSRLMTMDASTTTNVNCRFSLDRVYTKTEGTFLEGQYKGTRIKAVNVTYKIVSGGLSVVTPSLQRITQVNAATQTTTTLTVGSGLSTPSPAFALTSPGVGQWTRARVALTSPVYDDATQTSTISYYLTVQFVALSGGETTIQLASCGVEWDEDDDDCPFIAKSANYTLAIADIGSEIQVNVSAGNVTLTLPVNAAANTAFQWRVKVVAVGTGSLTIAPGAGGTLVGGVAGKTANQTMVISSGDIQVGDYIVVGNSGDSVSLNHPVFKMNGAWA